MENLFNYLISESEDAQAAKLEQTELAGLPDEEKYAVLMTGGSLGEQDKGDYYRVGSVFGKLYKQDLSKEEATEIAKRMRKSLSPGERKYYGINYRVVPMNKLKKIS